MTVRGLFAYDDSLDDETTLEDGASAAILELELSVRDREVIDALSERPKGPQRDGFALDALRIGVLALRHAQGQIDAESIRREGARVVGEVQRTLREHVSQSQERTTGVLKEYFDPKSGRLAERVESLVSDNGELSQLLRRRLAGDGSELARTLDTRLGAESPLMKLLDPEQARGVVASLRAVVDAELAKQRDTVLKEFSLDNRDGSLARLVGELKAKHGDLSADLKQKIDDVVAEFSLDKEDSALSKLVGNVEKAQRTITDEFSLNNDRSALSRLKQMLEATQGAIHGNLTLDNEDSPLARLRRELWELLAKADDRNKVFQEDVKVALAKMDATRAEAERGTQHGVTFEEAVFEVVARVSQAAGDVAAATGATTGLIKNCKKGDVVVTLGPESLGAGAKIVIEAKQDASYTLDRACVEMEEARKNRGASFGLFVFSKRIAEHLKEPVLRLGHDVFVVWDAEDATTDAYLNAGLAIAKALSVRSQSASDKATADFEAIDKAVNEVEKRARGLDEIRKSAESIKSGSEKILDRVRIDRRELERQVGVLRDQVAIIRDAEAAVSDA